MTGCFSSSVRLNQEKSSAEVFSRYMWLKVRSRACVWHQLFTAISDSLLLHKKNITKIMIRFFFLQRQWTMCDVCTFCVAIFKTNQPNELNKKKKKKRNVLFLGFMTSSYLIVSQMNLDWNSTLMVLYSTTRTTRATDVFFFSFLTWLCQTLKDLVHVSAAPSFVLCYCYLPIFPNQFLDISSHAQLHCSSPILSEPILQQSPFYLLKLSIV